MTGRRITDRNRIIHTVAEVTDTAVQTTCGRIYARGRRGSIRIWDHLAKFPGSDEKICPICAKVDRQTKGFTVPK